ncbi:hypothetical protein A9Z42_0014560 [Trichoderma parareesei]|uniref:Uncharacterized protein n=1 Tax=Trichoderma parareesei TaxID=858221 RepID=A0A2H2YYZ8_TRIPA|nr:hypothetical protein A9Z42_0014560 [Trichoderma parareesei]
MHVSISYLWQHRDDIDLCLVIPTIQLLSLISASSATQSFGRSLSNAPVRVSSNEWRLIQGLARLLDKRKAPHLVQSRVSGKRVHPEAEFFEIELRRVFRVQDFPHNLDSEAFEQCQAKLKSLCLLLDQLAWSRSIHGHAEGQTHHRLRALSALLESTSGVFDLANGPNKTLFRLPSDSAELNRCLRIVTECNDTLDKITAPAPQEPVLQPLQRQQNKRMWKKARIRNRASFVLGTLFEHFRCGMTHEVLLRLIEDPDEESMLPNLRENTGRGKALMLLIEKYGLFGAWADPATFEAGSSSKESLEQLIGKGAFKPLDLQALMYGASQSKFSTKDKRALAVKLGFCLMDFFDADITPRRIYFWNASITGPKKEFPYLSFDSKLPATTNPYNFRMGHPALLSFAKLLLEIDFGQSIELAISPDSSRNQAAWATLVSLVDRLEEDRGDSYLQAIRGCLNVHRKIAERLRTRDLDKKRAELRIRKTLYKEVVHKLELGLAESIPRPAHKRQRSESPSPSYRENEPRNSSSWRSPTQPSEPQRPIARHKRRRTPELQNWPSCVASELVTRECKFPSDCTVSELEASIDSSQPKSRRDFEVALICALRVEFDAVEALFDEYYEPEPDLSYGKAPGDPNAYTTGRICGHHVVLAFMPGMGKVNSASVAAGFRASFPDIKLGIVVGICGGVPFGRDEEKDVLLGDVVISTALVQFDLGRQYTNKFMRKDTLQDNLGRPTSDIRSFLAKLSGSKGRKTLRDKASLYLEELCEKDGFHKSSYPGADNDKLFRPTYRHKHQDPKALCICANCHSPYDDVCDVALEASCEELGCHDDELVSRERIDKAKLVTHKRYPFHETRLHEPRKPVIHFGVVVSGDSVMKSGHHRDEIASREKAIAFEMEGAGVWDSFPTIVIKSVCDYADSHKNKIWQRYAAATAAACMKAFLGEWRQAR